MVAQTIALSRGVLCARIYAYKWNVSELRKESRRLENEIDMKLVSFSKLGSTYSHRDSSDSSLGVGSSGHVFDTMALEIEQLLSKVSQQLHFFLWVIVFFHHYLQLRSINEALNEYVSTMSTTSPATALYHTLQRHNEILQDYSQEFNRTKVG